MRSAPAGAPQASVFRSEKGRGQNFPKLLFPVPWTAPGGFKQPKPFVFHTFSAPNLARGQIWATLGNSSVRPIWGRKLLISRGLARDRFGACLPGGPDRKAAPNWLPKMTSFSALKSKGLKFTGGGNSGIRFGRLIRG